MAMQWTEHRGSMLQMRTQRHSACYRFRYATYWPGQASSILTQRAPSAHTTCTAKNPNLAIHVVQLAHVTCGRITSSHKAASRWHHTHIHLVPHIPLATPTP